MDDAPVDPYAPPRTATASGSPLASTTSRKGRTARVSAIVAHAVAGAETHWSRPCGNLRSKWGWKGQVRLFTNQDPSSNCVRKRYSMPRRYSRREVVSPPAVARAMSD